jgi:AraC-like DNA-binding protein
VNLYIEQSCYHLIPGDLFLITPEQLHRSVCLDTQPYNRVIINIKEDVLNKLSSTLTDLSSCFHHQAPEHLNHVYLSGDYMNHYLNLSKQLHFFLTQREYGSDLLSDAYLTQLLVFINKKFSNHTYQDERNIMPDLISKTMEFISSNLTGHITLSLLSQHFYLSGTYISSQFKRHTGLTLRAYILDQRIALAKRLLADGHNVSETCYKAGFTDYSNFIRSFTNLTGIPPGKYAKHRQV